MPTCRARAEQRPRRRRTERCAGCLSRPTSQRLRRRARASPSLSRSPTRPRVGRRPRSVCTTSPAGRRSAHSRISHPGQSVAHRAQDRRSRAGGAGRRRRALHHARSRRRRARGGWDLVPTKPGAGTQVSEWRWLESSDTKPGMALDDRERGSRASTVDEIRQTERNAYRDQILIQNTLSRRRFRLGPTGTTSFRMARRSMIKPRVWLKALWRGGLTKFAPSSEE
jgi:hypothetical protein